MAGIFIYAENKDITLQMLTLGLQLKRSMPEDVCAITLDKEQAQDLLTAGADKVYVLENESTWPEAYAKAIADLLKTEEAVLFVVGASARGRDIAARVAAYLKTGLVSDAIKVDFTDGGVETQRLMYGGAVLCTEAIQGMAVVSVAPGKYPPALPAGENNGEIIRVAAEAQMDVTINQVEPVLRLGTDIKKAKKVVGVGRGIAQKEDMGMAEEFAAAIGAELGCTRSIAEELHWLPNEVYIGISGQTIRPELYLAIGISGQIQHVAGIRDAGTVVAIDKNENAPIFKAADYGIVGDLYEILPLLTKAIGELE